LAYGTLVRPPAAVATATVTSGLLSLYARRRRACGTTWYWVRLRCTRQLWDRLQAADLRRSGRSM